MTKKKKKKKQITCRSKHSAMQSFLSWFYSLCLDSVKKLFSLCSVVLSTFLLLLFSCLKLRVIGSCCLVLPAASL